MRASELRINYTGFIFVNIVKMIHSVIDTMSLNSTVQISILCELKFCVVSIF